MGSRGWAGRCRAVLTEDSCRCAHVERLVRTLIVKAFNEIIELGLLLQEVLAGRLGGLQLERQMHAFVAAVLLRVAGLDALDLDAKAEPPNRELGEIQEGIWTGKRHTIIGTDGLGQAELHEGSLSRTICAS